MNTILQKEYILLLSLLLLWCCTTVSMLFCPNFGLKNISYKNLCGCHDFQFDNTKELATKTLNRLWGSIIAYILKM